MSAPVEISRIQADALTIRPSRVLAWLWAAPWIALGFVARVLWVGVALALASARAGWVTATVSIEQAQADAARRRGGP